MTQDDDLLGEHQVNWRHLAHLLVEAGCDEKVQSREDEIVECERDLQEELLTSGVVRVRDVCRLVNHRLMGDIPVPPKYTSADFISSSGARYWALRGKLDVPKERWVSFPHCDAEDGSMVIAWAGYDHLQLARVVSSYYVEVQEKIGGRDDPRLVPLLSCLIELLPWLKQWHNDVDPEFGMQMGDYFEGFVNEEARNLSRPEGGTGWTLDEIKGWQPPKKTKRKATRKR